MTVRDDDALAEHPHAPTLSIGDLARRTGVEISTLRAWETRYGFPTPKRLRSGHRRYSERDVETVSDVVRHRRAGSTLESALSRARADRTARRSSISSTLRAGLSNISPQRLSRAGMLAVSRAIEDEAVANAERGVFIGAFQHVGSFRSAQHRWVDFARTSELTIALATFPRARQRRQIWEVPLSTAEPISREWAVMYKSAHFTACLVGVEQLRSVQSPPIARFEALWTVEPDVVREALLTATTIAYAAAPQLAEQVRASDALLQTASANYDVVRCMTSLTNRIVGYLQ